MACSNLKTFPALNSFQTKQREQTYKWIKGKINYDDERKGYPHNFHKEISFFGCLLPPWHHMHPQFQKLYTDAVLDKSVRDDLEECGELNWCLSSFARLLAVAVANDGNCLLHAASFAMWSVEDDQHILRELLLLAVATDAKGSYKHRWWHQKLQDLKALKPGSKIINTEWDEVVRSISSLRRAGGTKATPYSFLESIHIYVLANILQRPIVIVAGFGTKQSKLQTVENNHIAGIYLPLEWPPIRCCKTPLILGFSKGHFCPLLPEPTANPGQNELLFPLVNKDFNSLNVRFLSQQEEHRASELLQSYLRVREVIIPVGESTQVPVPSAVLRHRILPPELDIVSEHFKVCQQLALPMPTQLNQLNQLDEARLHQIQINSQTKVAPMRSFSESYHMSLKKQALKGKNATQRGLSMEEAVPCITKDCPRQGSAAQRNFCDTCFKNYTIAEAGAELVSINLGQQKAFVLRKNNAERSLLEPELHVPVEPSAPREQSLVSNAEPLSMLDERCLNKCGYRCSQHTYPFCHECFECFSKHKTPPDPRPPSAGLVGALSSLGLASPAAEAGAGGVKINDVNSPCGNLMLFSPSPPLTPVDPLSHVVCPPLPATNLLAHVSPIDSIQQQHQKGNSNDKFSDQSEQLAGPLPLHHRLDNGRQLNLSLNPSKSTEIPASIEAMQSVVAEHVESNRIAMSEHRQAGEGEDEEVIEVSETKETCVSPFCEEFVTFPHKLCEKCQDVLKAAHRQYNARPSNQVAPRVFSTEEAVEAQPQRPNQLQTHNLSGSKMQGFTDQAPAARQQVEMRVKQRGDPCITTGCANYGDPANAFMCSHCYERALKEYEKLKREHHKTRTRAPPVTPLAQTTGRKNWSEPIAASNQAGLSSFAPSSSSYNSNAPAHAEHTAEAVPISLLVTNKSSLSPGSRYSMHGSLENFPTYDINVLNQGFARQYDRLGDQTRAGLKTCRMAGCGNYGNPSKGGYCNTCHAKREEKRYRERIAKYGENVPDCYTSQQNSI